MVKSIRFAFFAVLIGIAAGVALGACADPPPGAGYAFSPRVAGDVAYAYEAVAAARMTIDEALKAGTITREQAAQALAATDHAREFVDAAQVAYSAGDVLGASEALTQVSAILKESRR